MTNAITILHKFESDLPDGPEELRVRPSNWNDKHEVTLTGLLALLADIAVSNNTFPRIGNDGNGAPTAITDLAINLIAQTNAAGMQAVIGLTALLGAINGIATLDAGGKLAASQIPALAINETFIVASEAAMLALTAERGDVAVRTDTNTTYILSTDDPTTLGDWKQFLFSAPVQSVAGLTGAIGAAALKNALSIAVADITNASADGRSLISAANYAAMRALLALSATDSPTFAGAQLNGLLMLAGATSGHPALKRNGAKLQARLADDSALSTIEVATQTQGDNSNNAASTAYVDAAAGAAAAKGGFLNRFYNAPLDVWQRGVSGTVVAGSPAFTADGWVVSSTGANIAWDRQTGRALTRYALRLTGNTSMSDTYVRQRIEGKVAKLLAGQAVTQQLYIYNDTGASITPTLTVRHADAEDNWASATTDVNAQALQSCPAGAWTQLSYTFTAHALAGLGLEVRIGFGASLNANTKSVQICEMDIRAAASVQPAELRALPTEFEFCRRYLRTSYGNGTAPGTASALVLAGGSTAVPGTFQAGVDIAWAMRAAPTISYWDGAGTANKVSSSNNGGASFVNNVTPAGGPFFQISQRGAIFNGYDGVTAGSFWAGYSASAEL